MVVVRATYAKFTTSRHAVELRRRLLATDRMWGAGVGRTAALTHTGKWPGKNLLGEALMEVRARLRLEGSDGSLIVKSGA
jgi:predicted NAD-dependent protein-ADP-ribosyltransferase YbiA (DUF1768 family)